MNAASTFVRLTPPFSRKRRVGKGEPPRWRVRCPDCKAERYLTGFPAAIMKHPRCVSCAAKGRAKRP